MTILLKVNFYCYETLAYFSIIAVNTFSYHLGEIPSEIANFPNLSGIYLFNNTFSSKY